MKIRLAVDGGCGPTNPGEAAWAVAILDSDNKIVEYAYGRLGVASNNVAEYEAVIKALELAQEKGASDVVIQSDSELVVKQVHGFYRVLQHQLQKLNAKVLYLMANSGFNTCELKYVPREENKLADKLVNIALGRIDEDKIKPFVALV